MQVFITGTDTNVGKTLIASWLAVHTGYPYFKPIQTGHQEANDSRTVKKLSGVKIYPESYRYPAPLSPHLAATRENDQICLSKICLPSGDLIVEGAGGLLVPINSKHLMIDLIKYLDLPVILVARTELGTINHSLLSIEALKLRGVKLLGVIMNGDRNIDNSKSIAFYSNTAIMAEFPALRVVDYSTLKNIIPPRQLLEILQNKHR